jgi:hypothetical protein
MQIDKLPAKHALESLIAQCQREIRNLERFEDARALVATFDLKTAFERAIEAADALEDTFRELEIHNAAAAEWTPGSFEYFRERARLRSIIAG